MTPVTFKPDDRVEWSDSSRAPRCTKTITNGVKAGIDYPTGAAIVGWSDHQMKMIAVRRIDFNSRENVNQAVLTNL